MTTIRTVTPAKTRTTPSAIRIQVGTAADPDAAVAVPRCFGAAVERVECFSGATVR